MTLRRASAPLLFALLLYKVVSAQSPSSQLLVSVSPAGGGSPSGARLEVRTDDTAAHLVATGVGAHGDLVALVVPPGHYRLRATATGLQPVETAIVIGAGEAVALSVQLARDGTAETSTSAETDRFPLAYQTRFDEHRLDALPHSRSAWSLLETAHSSLVSDRIDGGGLTTGERPMLGQGSSATQTTYRLNGVDVTDPEWTGTPLSFPDLRTMQSVVVTSASLDASAVGPAPAVDLYLKQPGTAWSGSAEFTGAPSSIQADAGEIAPIERLESWTDGGAAAGGALGPSARLFLAGRASHVERVERETSGTLDGTGRSVIAHLSATTGSGDQVRALGAFTGLSAPLATRARFDDRTLTQSDDTLLVHGSWERARNGRQWSVDAGYQRASRDADVTATEAGGVMERLKDGPPLALVASDAVTRQRWSLAARLTPGSRSWLGTDHALDAGVSVSGAAATVEASAQPAFGELVNGVAARVWDVSSVGPESRRSSVSFGAFVADRMPINEWLTVNAALRLDVDRGSAEGSQDQIGWASLLPRAHVRWRPRGGAFSITSGYGWYAHRLPLGYLAVGDPAGMSGTMYRWDDRDRDRAWTSGELTPVAAVGLCCTAGEASQIDADLRRPVTREFRIGGEHTIGGWRLNITGLDRREDRLVTLVNTGVTPADYTVSYVDDPGVDVAGLSGSAPLPIYDRRPESALRDRYRLTNSSAIPSRYQSVDIVAEHDVGDRWFFRFGGIAYLSEGVGANRGYRSDENDQGLIGEAFVTPNAQTYARGRLFYDRAFMMKVLGGYTAPRIVSGAFVARYQDGQPFARLVLADGLTQGRDLVQTYGRGGQRFTYTVTLDTRIAADWRFAGSRSVGLVLDAFNLLNMANEVEEDIVTGPAFRAITAVQPPRVIHLGARLAF